MDIYMKTFFTTIIAILFFANSNQAIAQPIDYLTCNLCSVAEQKVLAIASGRNGKVNVINFSDFESSSYYVFNEPGEHSARPVKSPEEVTQSLTTLKNFNRELQEVLTGVIPLNNLAPFMYGSTNLNIINIVSSNNARADIAQAMTKYYKSKITANLRTVAALLTVSAISQAIPATYVITVSVPNSNDTYQFKFSSVILSGNGDVSLKFDAVADSGRSDGILITASGGGSFSLSGDLAKIEAFINAFGFTVQYAAGDILSGRGTIGCGGTHDTPCQVKF
jgi:hypothetical protein